MSGACKTCGGVGLIGGFQHSASPGYDSEPCPECEERAVKADLAYNELKNSGELRRMEDDRALMVQLNEGPLK